MHAIELQTPSAPGRAALGLRMPHARELLLRKPALALVEVHSENFFGGGASRAVLERVRADYPISLHGVGMSLGGVDPLDELHLAAVKRLASEFEPAFVSDHACFTSYGHRNTHDLWPLPHTEEALKHLIQRVALVQERLGRRLLVENVTTYFRYPDETLTEAEFLTALARRTGCGILLDVNNAYVSAHNLGEDAAATLTAIPPEIVVEMHLAGYTKRAGLLLDTHSSAVQPPVWDLFALAARRFPHANAVIEWDADLPDFDTLLEEAYRASEILAPRSSGLSIGEDGIGANAR